MKSVIIYTASKVPVNSNLNVSIVQKKVSKTEYVNWANKTEFTNFVDTLYVPAGSDTYCEIVCQCGEKYIYANKSAVPNSSLICNCGRKVLVYGA